MGNRIRLAKAATQRLTTLIAAFLLLIPSLSGLAGNAQADTSIWVNGNNISAAMDYCTNLDYTTFRAQKYQHSNYPPYGWVSAPDKSVQIFCAAQNNLGIIGSSVMGHYVQFNGSPYAQLVTYGSSGVQIWAVPNSRQVIVNRGSSGSFTTYFYDNLVGKGQSTIDPYGERTFALTSPFPAPFQNTGGYNPGFNMPVFSQNGQWAVGATGYALIRMNMANHTFQTFTRFTGGASTGVQAVSNDGRYVLRDTTIYDLSSCTPNQAVDSYTVSGTMPGCTTRNISPQLAAALPGFQNLTGMGFSADNYMLQGYAQYIPPGGTATYTRIKINPAGYTAPVTSYLAMGDSFASGEGETRGGTWYEVGTDEQATNLCHLSKRSYPYIIAKDLGMLAAYGQTPSQDSPFHNIACSGATIDHVLKEIQYGKEHPLYPLDNWLPGGQRQIDLVRTPSAITISIGGNNIGFADKLIECISPGTCKYASDPTERTKLGKEIADQYATLKTTYQKIIAKTKSSTKLYVVGYPQIVSPNGSCGNNVRLDSSETQLIYQATHYLNQVAKAAAESAGAYYVNTENALIGRNLCSGTSDEQMAVNGATAGNDNKLPWYFGLPFGTVGVATMMKKKLVGNESYHPNATGHQLMHDTLSTLTGGNLTTFDTCPNTTALLCPSGTDARPLDNQSKQYFGSDFESYVNYLNNPNSTLTVSLPPVLKPIVVNDQLPNRQVHIHIEDLKPSSTITLTGHSTPVSLGSFTADANGVLDTTVTVPTEVEAGYHTIHATITNLADQQRDYYEPVEITGPQGDVNGNGIPDTQESCSIAGVSNQDVDQDDVDDACDGFVGAAIPTNLYRARNGNPANGESASTIYIERHVARTQELFGFSAADDDPDADGWAIVGHSSGTADEGAIAHYWLEDTQPTTAPPATGSPAPTTRYIPHVSTRHSNKGCLELKPADLSAVTSGQTRLLDEVGQNTSTCRTALPDADTDSNSTPDNQQPLYRARNGDTQTGEDASKVYIERNLAASEAILGISDYDQDADGWATIAHTSGSNDGDYKHLYLYDPAASTTITQTQLLALNTTDRRTIKPLATALTPTPTCLALLPASTIHLADPVKAGETRLTETLNPLPSGTTCD